MQKEKKEKKESKAVKQKKREAIQQASTVTDGEDG